MVLKKYHGPIYASLWSVVIPFKQLFQMNYQQHRNLPSYSPLPQFSTTYHPPQNAPSNSHSQYHLERQSSTRNNPVKMPFNLKEYSFEMKEYFRPQQTTLNAPLTFNMQSPTKLKAKKGNRPASKGGNKSFVNPYTKQLQNEFFKNQLNPMTSNLQDFSKTTSTINGQSFLNQQQIFTEPSEQRIYTPLKSYQQSESSKVIHSNSLKILYEREPQNKIFVPNTFNHSNSTYLQRPVQSSNSKSRENAYIIDQRFLLQEIKGLKQMNENYQKEIVRLNLQIKGLKSGEQKKDELRNSRKQAKYESKQLELQYQQNNKLLAHIEEMEKDLKGKVELNRYLEHQCNLYSEKHDKLQKQFDSYKTAHAQQNTKQEQIISIFKKQVNDLENEANLQKIGEKARKDQIMQLKKSLQLQGQKLEELSTNNQIEKSEINVLNKKLENFQVKYEKLMYSHCESELKLHDCQEQMQREHKQWQQTQSSLLKELKTMEQKYNIAIEQKQDMYMQLSSSKGELIQANNKIIEMKTFYQEQYSIVSQQLIQTNKIVKSKTQENQHIHTKIQAKIKEIEGLQNRIREITPVIQQVKVKTQENLRLQALLKQKCHENALLQQRQKTLQYDYNRMSSQLQQKNQAFSHQSLQINDIKLQAGRLQAQYKDMNKKYQMLRHNYEGQSLRFKQIQSNLIQNQFDYNILQRDFSQYTIRYNTMQAEYDNVRQLNQGLQSLHNQIVQKNKNEFQVLQAKNMELIERIQGIYVEYNEFKRVSEENQRQIQHKIENYEITIERINNQYEQLQEQLANKKRQSSQNLHKMTELETRYALVQSQYKQLIQQNQQSSLAKHADLAQSCKSQVQTWQLLSKKQLQIESLQNKIQDLQSSLQSKTKQLMIRGQLQAKEQLLKQQIASLMLIINENEKRSQEQKHESQKTIHNLKEELQSLSKRFTQEELQYKSIILELKQLIAKLQRQDQAGKESKDQINKMKTSIMQAGQLKQWNSFSEYLSSESLESPSKPRKAQSAEQLHDEMEGVDYIQMDREGVNYLCELLNIEISSGNILNQIVVRVQNTFNEVSLSRKTEEAYRQVLEAFGVQQGAGSFSRLMGEITTFKESLSLVIEQLKQQQQNSQALRGECQCLRVMHADEQQKGLRILQELHGMGELNNDLNEAIFTLTAKLCNQKIKMTQAMSLAKVCISDTSIRSEKFVTARSIGEEASAWENQQSEVNVE